MSKGAPFVQFGRKYYQEILVVLILGLFFTFHAFLISRTLIVDSAGIRTTYISYGDIRTHLTQVTKFAYGPLFDFTDPTYYGHSLQYPFAIDFLSALLLRLTGYFSFSFFAPVFLFALRSLTLLYFLYKRFAGGKLLPVFLVLLFFFGGGFGGYAILTNAFHTGGSFSGAIKEMSAKNISTTVRMDAKYPQQNIDYGAPLTQSFMHQRTFFIGFFLVLLLLFLLLKREEEKKTRYSVLIAVIYGVLPICHTHSFIAASFILFGFFAAKIFQKNYKEALEFVKIVFLGALVAAPQIAYLTSASGGSSGTLLHLRLGFMAESGIGSATFASGGGALVSFVSYFRFLLLNFGIELPLFLAMLAVHFFRRDESTRWKSIRAKMLPISLSAFFLFFAVMTIQFQPWDFDDNKVLLYWQLLSVPFIFVVGREMLAHRKKLFIALGALCALLFSFSGILDVAARAIKTGAEHPVVFSQSALSMSQYVKKHIPYSALVLTSHTFANPLSSLAGRSAYLGYPGWLWSHGVSFSARQGKLQAFYKNPQGESDIPKEFAFSYILVDDEAVNSLGASREYFNGHFKKVFEAGQYALYQK